MSNFEMACNSACNKWVNDIEVLPEIKYSSNHVNKIESILRGKRIFNVYVSKNVFRFIVIAAIILSLSLISFGVYEGINSKKIIDGGNGMYIVEGAKQNTAVLVKDFQYGYIPEGFVEEELNEFEIRYEREGEWALKRFSNGDKQLEIIKYRENATRMILNYDNIKTDRFEEDGIQYLRTIWTSGDDSQILYIMLEWAANEYWYVVSGNISQEDAIKIAKDMK